MLTRRRFFVAAAAAFATKRLPVPKSRPRFVGVIARGPSRSATVTVEMRRFVPVLPAHWIKIDFVIRTDGKVEFKEPERKNG